MTRSWRDLPLTFAALGATGAVFGPALPALADQVGGTAASASLVVSALFAGLLLGVALLELPGAGTTSPARLRGCGTLAQAVGLVGVALSASPSLLIAGGLLTGIGFGLTEATASAVVVARRDGARALTMLGAVFAIAAILTPAVVALSLLATGSVWPAIAGVAVLQVAATAGTAAGADGQTTAQTTAQTPGGPASTGVALAAVLVLYVGAEVLLSTWAAELVRTQLAVGASVAALAATGFWGCLALGRWAGSHVAVHMSVSALLRSVLLAAAAACGAAALLIHLGAGAAALVCLAVAVVLLGPAYALALAVGAGGSDAPRPRVAARRIGLGALGGALVPAVVAPLTAVGGVASVPATAAVLLAAATWLMAGDTASVGGRPLGDRPAGGQTLR